MYTLSAELHQLRGEFQEAADDTARVIAFTVTMKNQPYYAALNLVRVIRLLNGNMDTAAGVRIDQIAAPFIMANLPEQSAERALYNYEVTNTYACQGLTPKYLEVLTAIRPSLARLQLEPWRHFILQSSLATREAALRALSGGKAGALEALRSHPLAARRDEILKAGRFPNFFSMVYALVEMFVAVTTNGEIDRGWGPAFDKPLADPPTHVLVIEEEKSLRAFARVLLLAKAGDTAGAKGALRQSAKSRLAMFEIRFGLTEEGMPQPNFVDQIVFASLAGLEPESRSDKELLLQSAEFMNRNPRYALSDTLSRLSGAPDEEARELIHSATRISDDRAEWSRLRTIELVNWKSSPDASDKRRPGAPEGDCRGHRACTGTGARPSPLLGVVHRAGRRRHVFRAERNRPGPNRLRHRLGHGGRGGHGRPAGREGYRHFGNRPAAFGAQLVDHPTSQRGWRRHMDAERQESRRRQLDDTGPQLSHDRVREPTRHGHGARPQGRKSGRSRAVSARAFAYPSSTWVGFARWGEAKGIGVVAPFLSEGERSELGLAVFDSDGHMTSEGRITLPEGVRGSNAYTGAVAVSGESALLLVSKRRAPNASNKIKGALGLERFCWDGGATFAYLVDLKTLAVRASNAIGNVSLSRIVVDGDGFLVAGTRPLACDLGDRGFIGKLDAALLLTGLWTDDGPFKSAVSGILRTPDGIKGVGSIERTLGVREIKTEAAVPDARDVASVRAIVSNRYARSEAFVVEVKTDGQAMRQTSSSGLRLVPFGIIDSGSPRFVYGSASFFPWWGWMH